LSPQFLEMAEFGGSVINRVKKKSESLMGLASVLNWKGNEYYSPLAMAIRNIDQGAFIMQIFLSTHPAAEQRIVKRIADDTLSFLSSQDRTPPEHNSSLPVVAVTNGMAVID